MSERHDLIIDTMPLVGHIVKVAVRSLPNHIDRDDLLQVGMLALVTSAKVFDPERGIPFGTFAAIRIQGAITDELRRGDWAPRSLRPVQRQIEDARNQLAVTLGRSPRSQEVADTLGVSLYELSRIDSEVHRASVLRLQGFPPETAAAMLQDLAPGPEQSAVSREQVLQLHAAISRLPERLRVVVEDYYLRDLKMGGTAARLGVVESRVSQMRSEAVRLLRAMFEEADLIAA